MSTTVVFYTEPTNLDYLLPDLRFHFGDLTGAKYSDQIMRTALVNAVKYLQKKWSSKYQIYTDDILVDPQGDVPAGYVRVNTSDGEAFIPSGLAAGSLFRNPYNTFVQSSPPVIESDDEMAIILAATYLLRKTQTSSSVDSLVSWSTEDIRYSNLAAGRTVEKMLLEDKQALDDYFRKKLARPIKSTFPLNYIPGL
jgi:hypothetical protein